MAGKLSVASTKRCGTCIDRKVRCDRGRPACSTCIRSNRVCQGYHLRLSWPRDNDRKRSIIVPVQAQRQLHGRRAKHWQAIHVTAWDMEMRRTLTVAWLAGRRPAAPRIYPSLSSLPSGMKTSERDLFYYFKTAVSDSLPVFNNESIGSILIRVGLSGTTHPFVAVQRAMLALAHLFRYGPGFQADQLKLSALRALIASTQAGIRPRTAIQHVAAGLALCHYEMNHHSESSNQWLWYISGAKDVMANVPPTVFTEADGLVALTDWAYYHEVFSQFSMRHWRTGTPEHESRIPLHILETDSRLLPCTTMMRRNKPLELFSRVLQWALPPSDPRSRTEGYLDTMALLEVEAESMCKFDVSSVPSGAASRAEVVSELYRIAVLIYLARASHTPAGSSEKLTRLVDLGFQMLSGLSYFDRPFPILLIGFEARDDEQRVAVLDLISRTQRQPFARHRLESVKTLLHSIWNQRDLQMDGGGEVPYMEMVTAVLSASDIVPTLA